VAAIGAKRTFAAAAARLAVTLLTPSRHGRPSIAAAQTDPGAHSNARISLL